PSVTVRTDSADPSPQPVFRLTRTDPIDPARIRRLDSGEVVIPGCLGRPGVLECQDPDGTRFREWRPSSLVNDPIALGQLNDAPVTSDHPVDPATGEGGLVTPENSGTVRRGHVSAGSVRVDAGLPWAD